MSSARTAFVGLFVGMLTIATLAARAAVDDAIAEATHRVKRAPATNSARIAPDITATITKQPPPPPPNVLDDGRATEIPAPVTLPSASRARFRACGEAWREMKLAGTTGDDNWRDFAFKCLVGKVSTKPGN